MASSSTTAAAHHPPPSAPHQQQQQQQQQSASPPQQQQQQHPPWPLYDLFLDLPHPNASQSCPGPFLIPSPIQTPVQDEIQSILPQIARFAFPEYDESESSNKEEEAKKNRSNTNLPKIMNRYDVYMMEKPSFMQFTFSLQLQTGSRLHGHVRRYLPPHLVARTRYDVGRRGERALVVLTRATGADLLYASILKSIEAISSQQATMSTSNKILHGGNPQQWFLHQLSRYHQHLTQIYAANQEGRGKPLVAAIPGLELGEDHDPVVREKYKNFDIHKFIIPTNLLQSMPVSNVPPPQAAAGSLLPLLRCVGVAHAVRILAALLSERRVVMVSSSPTRLAFCSHAAVSMLAVGLLHWQHLYIPVLPPHLWQYLAAPYPYLIGILTSTLPRLDRTDGLGEVLIIQLDTNQLETRGMDSTSILQRLPDLFRSAVEQTQQQLQQQVQGAASPSEMLAQDLFEILKQDKKILYGESALDKVGETAVKAGKAVKKTFLKLRDKGRQYLQQRSGEKDEASPPEEPEEQPEINFMASDYIYTEGCHNEAVEQDVRIAFTAFFLCMIGDMRWYLTTPPTGGTPVLDRKKFLQQKRAMGDGEGTPMWPLLNNFCQTQMLEEFAKARVVEVQTRPRPSADAPLFLQCAAYCRQHKLDFSLLNIRKITRQMADSSPSRLTGMLQTNARRTAMALTSNKPYEGDYGRAVAQLVEQSRESSSILFDVMSVIWLRMRDSRGMQWKHGYQALQILRNLLYHGPMAAITEATDGIAKIRAMKSYENIRAQSAQQVRTAAAICYNLLVDRARLFNIRRYCAERRRILQSENEPKRTREVNTRHGVPFRNIHAMMHPNASRGTVVQIPPRAPTSQKMVRDTAGTQQAQEAVSAAAATAPYDFFATDPSVPMTTDQQAANDLAGLFGDMGVSPSSGYSTPSQSSSNPFAAGGTASAPSSGNATDRAFAQTNQPLRSASSSSDSPNVAQQPPAFAQMPQNAPHQMQPTAQGFQPVPQQGMASQQLSQNTQQPPPHFSTGNAAATMQQYPVPQVATARTSYSAGNQGQPPYPGQHAYPNQNATPAHGHQHYHQVQPSPSAAQPKPASQFDPFAKR